MSDVLSKYDLLLPHDPETEQSKEFAPRPKTLDGKILGLLDNRKGNADNLLMRFGELLGERYNLKDIVYVTKPIFSRPAPEAMLEELEGCDVVLTAIAD
jgi:hypothetical protein